MTTQGRGRSVNVTFLIAELPRVKAQVLAISCVTNMAAGILDQILTHQEVMETGEKVRGQFEALLHAVLPRIAASLHR